MSTALLFVNSLELVHWLLMAATASACVVTVKVSKRVVAAFEKKAPSGRLTGALATFAVNAIIYPLAFLLLAETTVVLYDLFTSAMYPDSGLPDPAVFFFFLAGECGAVLFGLLAWLFKPTSGMCQRE